MATDDLESLRRETRRIWDAKAAFWDAQMGEGNQFQQVLVGPSSDRLLAIQPGETVLDVGCGNGVFSRRLAALGAQVVGTDVSEQFVELARARESEHADRIEYRLVDATDEADLLTLGEGRFDAAVCNMALQDMPTIDPLLRALARLLKPAGRFVFTVPHPAFNVPAGSRLVLEETDRDGRLEEMYAVKLFGYVDVPPSRGVGMIGEPEPHYYFHRPLSQLLGTCFAAGFVLDGLEEPHFGPDDTSRRRPLGWGNFKQIPPVLAGRMRLDTLRQRR
jgi:2-polyprenyl-3-methyl-5-hydroxy-6-metoxy-1,4-benzoquinol methylase